jgi:hypothetical protein
MLTFICLKFSCDKTLTLCMFSQSVKFYIVQMIYVHIHTHTHTYTHTIQKVTENEIKN